MKKRKKIELLFQLLNSDEIVQSDVELIDSQLLNTEYSINPEYRIIPEYRITPEYKKELIVIVKCELREIIWKYLDCSAAFPYLEKWINRNFSPQIIIDSNLKLQIDIAKINITNNYEKDLMSIFASILFNYFHIENLEQLQMGEQCDICIVKT